MVLSDRAEEILETFWAEIHERKKTPDVTILKNNAAFQELLDGGFIAADNPPTLTKKGAEEGRLCVRRHRLAERLFADVLNVRGGLVHDAGCRFENVLSRGLEDNICILLGHPKTCPHGRSIPPGKCCAEKKKQVGSLVLPLSEMAVGQAGKIAYLHTEDRDLLKKIMAMGALPGVPVTLLQRSPSYVFQAGQSQFAVDGNVAERIHVRV